MIKSFSAAAACIGLLLSGFSPVLAEGPHRPAFLSPKPDDIRAQKSRQASLAAPYGALIGKYAAANGVDAELANAIIRIESNYNPKMRGSAGEIGLMQIKPATARMMGYSGPARGLYDPETNLRYGMKYLAMAQTLGGGETCSTVLKYNAGHAARHMNPVSKRYCGRVTMILAEG
nr:transglycosylase SLT domain-containing protein [uncultured Gellertiella sp.]